MAFPCDQFGGQEPGTNAEIAAFAAKHGFAGTLFAKGDVNGPGASAPWRYLRASAVGGGKDVRWNFAKFLVGRDGVPVKKYGEAFDAKRIARDVRALLEERAREGEEETAEDL